MKYIDGIHTMTKFEKIVIGMGIYSFNSHKHYYYNKPLSRPLSKPLPKSVEYETKMEAQRFEHNQKISGCCIGLVAYFCLLAFSIFKIIQNHI